MTASPFSDRIDHGASIPVIWFTLLFALVTYAAMSARALLNPYEINSFFDAKRIFSVVLGALVLWFAVRATRKMKGRLSTAQLLTVARVSALGALGLFVAREIYDLVGSGEFAENIAVNIRFMLTWIGYFVAAIAIFLAVGFYRQCQMLSAQIADSVSLPSAPKPQADYETADLTFDPRQAS